MLYIIYKNITEKQFVANKKTLQNIEKKIKDFFLREGFYVLKDADDSDVLALNFNTEKDKFSGNISLFFNDSISNPSYDITVVKAYDNGDLRKFKRRSIVENVSIEEIKNNYKLYFSDAIEIYKSINKEDLIDSVELHNNVKNIKEGLKPLNFKKPE